MTAYTEADVERLATVIHDARVGGISYGNYTLARWILDRWLVEETGRRWVFSLDSKPDVVMADGVHRYWSTHCRHGNHDLCKGACKGCASICICGCGCGCDPRPVEGSTPIASPARVGICGDEATNLAGLLNRPHHCVLPAGHDGWHEDDAVPPMRWSLNHDSLYRPLPAGEVVLAVPRDAPDGQATEESTEEQRAAAVTVKGCLGVDRGHGKNDVHYWRCPTPECVGHLCRKDGLAEGAILDGRRTIEPDETVSHD